MTVICAHRGLGTATILPCTWVGICPVALIRSILRTFSATAALPACHMHVCADFYTVMCHC